MAVYRVNKNRSYTVWRLPPERQRLSLKAVGLLSKMLSFNDGWKFSSWVIGSARKVPTRSSQLSVT